jgi:hypothetical protein
MNSEVELDAEEEGLSAEEGSGAEEGSDAEERSDAEEGWNEPIIICRRNERERESEGLLQGRY